MLRKIVKKPGIEGGEDPASQSPNGGSWEQHSWPHQSAAPAPATNPPRPADAQRTGRPCPAADEGERGRPERDSAHVVVKRLVLLRMLQILCLRDSVSCSVPRVSVREERMRV